MAAQTPVDLDQLDTLLERNRVLGMLIGLVSSGCSLARQADKEAVLMELAAIIEATAQDCKRLVESL